MNASAHPDHRPHDGRSEASHVVIPWLVRLRWVSVLALAGAAWAAAVFWRVHLPVGPLTTLLVALAGSNAALAFQLRSPAPRRGVIGASLLIDIGLLTGILYLVGGPVNPFSVVYLVEVTLAAVALGQRWALALALLSAGGYGYTFFHHVPLEFTDPAYGQGVLALHLSGMWFAVAAAALLIAHFVGRVSEALDRRERELAAARLAAARSERLTALLALGAGAAHELATPLSTISTVAGELERSLADPAPTARARSGENLALIRREVERCRSVLDQLSGRAGATSAADGQVEVPVLVADLRYRLGEQLARRLTITAPEHAPPITAPREPLRQALVALLRNAFDASPPDATVTLRIEQSDRTRLEIVDRGRGMPADELAHAGEPFFTTKPRGSGLGLGVFLARSFADQMGGRLELRSAPGQGTSAVLELPGRSS